MIRFLFDRFLCLLGRHDWCRGGFDGMPRQCGRCYKVQFFTARYGTAIEIHGNKDRPS